MDNQRLFLFLALALVVMLLWDAWQKDYGPKPPASVVSETLPKPAPAAVPEAPPSVVSDTGAVPGAPPGQSQVMASPVPAAVSGERIEIITDLLRLVVDTAGGDIRQAYLLAHPEKIDVEDSPIRLFNDELPDLFLSQTGLSSSTGAAPDHRADYRAEKSSYILDAGMDTLEIPLTWSNDQGLRVTKRYILHRDSYLIELDISIENQGSEPWSGSFYRQLQRTKIAEKNQSSFIYTYMGGAFSSSFKNYEKVTFEEMSEWKPQESYLTGGWAAMIQHYFIAAWIPPTEELNHYYSKALSDGRYNVGMVTQAQTVTPGASHNFKSNLYVGPKEQDRMEHAAPNLDKTVDYGFLFFIAKPLFIVLDFLHEHLGNWGWSIIILTMMIKLIFYKLSETSYRSMARMRKFQPKIMALRERYGNDKQRMSQAMMDLYKKEKINPLGGCLPIAVQIPVFIALYWVLLESVELRQADFIFWIKDLSTKDPYYVLPVLMGISMFVQQRLNPAPMDPIQKKVLTFLPLVFTFFFMLFPSGLVLYWVVNNLLSIAQQWYITQKIEKG